MSHSDDAKSPHNFNDDPPTVEEVTINQREAPSRDPPGHSNDSKSPVNLTDDLRTQVEGLNEAIYQSREVLTTHPPGHPGRATSLNNHAVALMQRSKITGHVQDLDGAIEHYREALFLRPSGHQFRSLSLNNLAIALSGRFDETGQTKDLEESIVLHHEALSLHPSGHPGRPFSLNNIATALHTRFQKMGKMEDLQESILHHREALSLHPPGHPHRSTSLNNLVNVLRERFEYIGEMDDLNEAILHSREALSLRPPGHPYRSLCLINLGNTLHTRFDRTGKMEDLTEAIAQHREALSLLPPGYPDRSQSLHNLANALQTQFEQTGRIEVLEEAITHLYEALSLHPSSHQDHAKFLNNLAFALQRRFEFMGNMEDLEESIAQHRKALLLHHPGHVHRPKTLNNLANALQRQFEQTGKMEDLDESIIQYREALSLCPPGDQHHPASLNNLGIALRKRFEQIGKLDDLEESIARHRKALSLSPRDHPEHITSINNLGHALQSHRDKTEHIEDLHEAIMRHREALSLCPPGHPARPQSLNNLAVAFHALFELTGKIEDLEGSIAQYREALSLHPPGHIYHSASLNNLADVLRTQFRQTEKSENLEESIMLHHKALSFRPLGHPDRSQSLGNLGLALLARFEQSHETGDLDIAFDTFKQAANDPYASSLSRFRIAKKWANHAKNHRHSSTIDAFSKAVTLLVHCLVATPTVELQQDFLASHTGSLPSDAASCAVEAGQLQTAVELLEQGRAMVWTRMQGFRNSVKVLHEIDHDLAEQFETLSTQLESLTTSSKAESASLVPDFMHTSSHDSIDAKMQLHHKLLKQFDGVVDKIRDNKGFEDFLRAVPFKTLIAAGLEGPVIIVNISQYSSHAIILRQDSKINSLVSIPLPDATLEVVHDLTSDLGNARIQHPVDQLKIYQVLRDLWEFIVSPVWDKLSELGVREKTRVWWCPTSALCSLPLHAAGPYAQRQKSFPEICISSYTSTLSALIRARSPAGPALSAGHLLAIGVTYNNQLHRMLPKVQDELTQVSQIPNIIVQQLKDKQVTPQRLLSYLQQYSWVHFACHGHLNTQPFHSSFELYNGQYLTLLELIQAKLPNAEFAFLSACHSAAGGTSTPDESIYLSAAFQFCGFRSTVGTLWPMADEDGPSIVKEFYDHIFQEGKAASYRDSARALSAAIRALRHRKGPEKVPIHRWICVVHIGA